MTLRSRLIWLTLLMMAAVAFVMTAVNLNSLSASSLNVAAGSSEMAARQLKTVLVRRLQDVPPSVRPRGLDEMKAYWNRSVVQDQELAALLEETMAQSSAILEINIAGENGAVLTSSNPSRIGGQLNRQADLRQFREANPVARATAILSSAQDFETRVPLGIARQEKPVFTIQILVSSVLLRAAILPELQGVVIASAVALFLAFLLAYWTSNIALRPLELVSHLLDTVASGDLPAPSKKDFGELYIIETKLNILGEQFRDVRANLEGALEKLDAESRRQVEDQIALARRLTAISKLTGGVAHEIKNPLNSIALRLEMLRSRVVEGDHESGEEFRVLTEEVHRLDRVVRTFLDFNRTVELQPVEVDVAAFLQDIAKFLEFEAESRGITIQTDLQPWSTKLDRDLMRQAVLNIAMNALEAMASGGTLTIDVTPGAIRLADTGPGISSDQLDKIFQLYFTTKTHGSGIGLAMAFRAAQLHGGTIEVESKLGQGTAFTIKL